MYVLTNKIDEDQMGDALAHKGENRNEYGILIGKPERRR
jgi:hypothetical protein